METAGSRLTPQLATPIQMPLVALKFVDSTKLAMPHVLHVYFFEIGMVGNAYTISYDSKSSTNLSYVYTYYFGQTFAFLSILINM